MLEANGDCDTDSTNTLLVVLRAPIVLIVLRVLIVLAVLNTSTVL